MKAQLITRFDNPLFQFQDVAKPSIKPGHLLVKVCATSVNPIDCKIRSGAVPGLIPTFPAILHGDVAGVVEEVAADVQDFRVGDEVLAYAGGMGGIAGALAEYMLVAAKAAVKKPSIISMREAAALPLVTITAWNALFQRAQLRAGQNILVHGGLGGVGHIAIQLAKWCGATVYTTVLDDSDVDAAMALGADAVINAKRESVADYVQRLTKNVGFDVVFDTVGGANLDRSLAAAVEQGTVVTTAARSTHDLTVMHNKALSLHAVFVLLPLLAHKFSLLGEPLKQAMEVVAAGKLKPRVDERIFSLEQAQEAHAWLESGGNDGKVVIGS